MHKFLEKCSMYFFYTCRPVRAIKPSLSIRLFGGGGGGGGGEGEERKGKREEGPPFLFSPFPSPSPSPSPLPLGRPDTQATQNPKYCLTFQPSIPWVTSILTFAIQMVISQSAFIHCQNFYQTKLSVKILYPVKLQ